MVDGTEYGEVRQYGNFSFLRIYEAGHEVPFYQPLASLAMFNRTIHHLGIADGNEPVTEDLSSSGDAEATHTEAFVALASSTGSLSASGSGSPSSQAISPSTSSSAANRAVFRPLSWLE